MSSNATGLLDRLRQPEYTGENRCVPCTVVNLCIALVLSGAVAAVATAFDAGSLAAPAAVAVLAFSLASIYLRGYLVPGTPTLTKRYFPDWLLAKFDKGPAGEATQLGQPKDGERIDDSGPEPADPETVLLEGGVLEPCADEDDLCLADGVRERWREQVIDVREGDRPARVAAFIEVDPDELTLHEPDGRNHVVVRSEAGTAARWESEAALLADVAGAELLSTEIGGWESLPLENRGQIVSGLRAFLEQCPTCDGQISIDGETVESCCRSYEVYAVTCNDCEARLLEVSA